MSDRSVKKNINIIHDGREIIKFVPTVLNPSWEILNFSLSPFLFFHLEIKIVLGYIMGMKAVQKDVICCFISSPLLPYRYGYPFRPVRGGSRQDLPGAGI
jgi:hypothetical protein